MFVYRYCQSVSGNVLFGLLRPRQLLASAILLIGAVDLVALAGLNMIIVSPTSTRSLLEDRHPDLFELVSNRTLVSFRGIENVWTLSTFAFLEFFCGVFAVLIACCVYGTYSALQSSKSTLSAHTLRLYKSLVNSLVLDLAFCLVLGATPIMVGVIAFSSHAAWASTATVVCTTVAGFYPLATHILWLLYIAPYRKSVRRVLDRTFQKKSSTGTLFANRGINKS
ncbi:hypothetical protein AAVH_09533 [Aphelenchoides avenae]|nr:hypothetical protein AAVH_09533 [Aphelenchus avenae]